MWTKESVIAAIRDHLDVAAEALDAIQLEDAVQVAFDAFGVAAAVLGRDRDELCVDRLTACRRIARFVAALRSRGVEADPVVDAANATGATELAAGSGGRFDPKAMRVFLDHAETYRCRIKVDGELAGSGCLVGPGLVLTAWHVLEPGGPKAPEPRTPRNVTVELADFTEHPARTVWSSKCGASEWEGIPPRTDAEVADHHDVALLSLQRPVGRHLAYAAIPPTAPVVRSDTTVFVLDFPAGADRGFGDGKVEDIQNVTSRLAHTVATAPGSSGGACFDRRFTFIGVHQAGRTIDAPDGTKTKGGRLVPLRLFREQIADYIANDIAPTAAWQLDGQISQLVIGRDDFVWGVTEAAKAHTPVRGIHVKRRRPQDADESGLGFSYRLLCELLLRRNDLHTIVTVPLDESIDDVLGDLATRVRRAGLPLAAGWSRAGRARARASTAIDDAALLAAAIDDAAAERERLVWVYVENPSVPLTESARLQLEGFVSAALTLPRLRVVLTGLETLPLAGQEFSSPKSPGDSKPGLLVEFVGTFAENDVVACLRSAARAFTGAQGHSTVIRSHADAALFGHAADNSAYPVAVLPQVVAHLQGYLGVLGSTVTKAAEGAPDREADGKASDPSDPGDPADRDAVDTLCPDELSYATLAAVDEAMTYAALSGPFDPAQAVGRIRGVHSLADGDVIAVAARLWQACDTSPGDGSDRWLLRGVARQRVLGELADTGRLQSEAKRRRRHADRDGDTPTLDLLDALAGTGGFADDAVRAALRDARGGSADLSLLERLGAGLSWAAGHAPRSGALSRVKRAITHQGLLEALPSIAEGTAAHDAEVDKVITWLRSTFSADSPLTRPGRDPAITVYVEGAAGTGKTALLDAVTARMLAPGDEWLAVRFDFDRAGLDVQNATGLTVEFARQLAPQVTDPTGEVQRMRLVAAGGVPGAPSLKGDSAEHPPPLLSNALARALALDRSPRVLLVLDSLQVLRERGATHAERLFAWIDQLAEVTRTPIAVLGAGEGDALENVHARIGERVVLSGLDDAGADRVLSGLGIDPASWPAIRASAEGSPVALRLAAAVAARLGSSALEDAGHRGPLMPIYLTRLLMSRWADTDLRRIAHDGLVVQRLDADVVRSVVAPHADVGDVATERAAEMLVALAAEDWLVEPDPLAHGFLRYRPEVRRAVLESVYSTAPERSAFIDESAAGWFGARRQAWAEVEAAYHHLQLMRHGIDPPQLDREVLERMDARAVSELPTVAQEFVRRSLGERSEQFRAPEVGRRTRPAPAAVRELRALNGRSDWLEGAHLYARAFTSIEPAHPSADVAATFLWRTGRWPAARRLVSRQGGWLRDDESAVEQLERRRLDALCRLELGAETRFDEVVQLLRCDRKLRRRVAEITIEPTLSSLVGAGLRFALLSAESAGPREDCPGDRSADRDPRAEDASAEPSVVEHAAAEPAAVAIRRWRDGLPSVPHPSGWARLAARVGLEGDASPVSDVLMARTSAVATPFAGLVETMSRLPEHDHLGEYAAAIRERLDALGNLAPHASEPWHDHLDRSRSLALHAFTDLGLLAELIGAAAYLRHDHALAQVADAAERWRRTVGGAWSYGVRGDRPRGWAADRQGDATVDVTVRDRIDALLGDQRDPAAVREAAFAELEAWAPEHPTGADVLALVGERSPELIATIVDRHARRAIPAHRAAAVLLRRGLPSAFVPAVAVLLTRPAT